MNDAEFKIKTNCKDEDNDSISIHGDCSENINLNRLNEKSHEEEKKELFAKDKFLDSL